jgi:hypothetical protein
MKRAVLFMTVAALTLTVGVFAQTANFAGKWVLDPAKSEMGGGPGGPGGGGGRPGGGGPPGGGRQGGGPGGGMGGPITITQTATELTIERTMGENVMKTIYKLDGSESVNETGRGKSTSVSKWSSGKLVTTIKSETPRGTMESTETRSLGADGTMIVETTMEGPNGPMTRKMVYNKQ